MRESLLQCIREGVEEINGMRDEKIPTGALDEVGLYGGGGSFDSMQLVNFLMIVEEKIEERLGIAVLIVSERAVSRKVSPFTSVSTLLDFLVEEIEGCPA